VDVDSPSAGGGVRAVLHVPTRLLRRQVPAAPRQIRTTPAPKPVPDSLPDPVAGELMGDTQTPEQPTAFVGPGPGYNPDPVTTSSQAPALQPASGHRYPAPVPAGPALPPAPEPREQQPDRT